MTVQLNAEIRNVAGKGAARSVRNNKKIPAVIYGEKTTPVAIALDGREFEIMLKTPGLRTQLFEIQAGDKKEQAILSEIQYHPVSDVCLHVDFKRIDVKKPVLIDVPVALTGMEVSKGIKAGGKLNIASRTVALVGTIDKMPEKIIVDLTSLDLMSAVKGSDLILPAGIELAPNMANTTFLTIVGKPAKEEAEAAPAAKGKGAAKPAAKPAVKK
jgi:large subunit ribosomal protein L25